MNAAKPERIAISPPMNFTSSLYCTAAAVAAPKKDVVVRALAVVSVSFIGFTIVGEKFAVSLFVQVLTTCKGMHTTRVGKNLILVKRLGYLFKPHNIHRITWV